MAWTRLRIVGVAIVVIIVVVVIVMVTCGAPVLDSNPPRNDSRNVSQFEKEVAHTSTDDQSCTPKIIHQTYSTRILNRKYCEIINKNLAKLPGYTYRFYDDSDMARYVKRNFDKRTYDAFMSINPIYGPAKADMFRYLVLYNDGGIYIDLKSKVLGPLDDLLGPDKGAVFMYASFPRTCGRMLPDVLKHGEYINWGLVSPKKHPFYRVLIESIVTDIENHVANGCNKSGKNGVLDVTGPFKFSIVLSQFLKNPKDARYTLMDRDPKGGPYFEYAAFDHKKVEGSSHYESKTSPVIIGKLASIPKVIYLTYKTRDAVPDKVFNNWKRLNPDYEIEFSDDNACKKFLMENFSPEFASYFDEIPYGAIKSDFWRLCKLYKMGGVYSDVDIEPIVPLSHYITDVTFFTSIEQGARKTIRNLRSGSGAMFQAVVACTPGHPVIRDCINILYNKRPMIKNLSYNDLMGTRDMYNALLPYLEGDILVSGTHYRVIDGKPQIFKLAEEICPTIRDTDCRVIYKGVNLFNSRYPDYVRGKGFVG